MSTETRLQHIEDRLTSIENRMAKSAGFVGGIVFVVSGLWIVLSTIIYWTLKIKTGS